MANAWPEAVSICRDLVRIPSHGGEGPGVEAAAIAYLVQRFAAQGIRHRVQHGPGGEPLNLVAEVGPDGGSTVLLNSHLDTVPPGPAEAWTHPPLAAREADGRIYGRGSADAKGPLACMVAACERLWREREGLQGRVMLAAVGAEERGGLGTRQLLREGVSADFAIVGEPTSCVPHVAHKGALRLALEVTGRQAHASAPGEGVNAISKMAGVVQALEGLADEVAARRHPLLGSASLAVTTIQGGTALNVIPGSCRIDVDRRLLPGEAPEEALAEVEAAVGALARRDPELQVAVRVVRTLAAAETASPRLVAVMEETAGRVLGRPVAAGGFTACCDMTLLVHQGGVPTIILGPGDLAQAHQTDEHVPVAHLHAAAEVYYRACLALTGG